MLRERKQRDTPQGGGIKPGTECHPQLANKKETPSARAIAAFSGSTGTPEGKLNFNICDDYHRNGLLRLSSSGHMMESS